MLLSFLLHTYITDADTCSVLTTELACLRCAKSQLKNFLWEKSHETAFIAATHHIDEQVMPSHTVLYTCTYIVHVHVHITCTYTCCLCKHRVGHLALCTTSVLY